MIQHSWQFFFLQKGLLFVYASVGVCVSHPIFKGNYSHLQSYKHLHEMCGDSSIPISCPVQVKNEHKDVEK